MFNGSRLAVARHRRGHTKRSLAKEIGVEARAVSGWENEEYPPTSENEVMLSQILGFPSKFFRADDLEEPSPDSVSFRSMKRMRAYQRNATISACSIAFLLSDWVEDRFSLPQVDVPDLREDAPAIAAATLRECWGLGERRAPNMVHLLESRGVRVFSLSQNCVEVDACSLWQGNKPYVFLNTFKSAERGRFDAAHELGHLVLHRHAAPMGQKAELQANQFASAFLMPEGGIRSSAPNIPSLGSLIRLKRNWTVSVAALAYRLHDLDLVSDWHYRMLCIELQKRGYRTNEPNGAAREGSQVWDKVFASLRAEGMSRIDLARELVLPEQEITDLVFGLVTTAVGTAAGPLTKTPARKGHLRVVK